MLHEPIKHVQIFDGAAGTELSGLPEAKGRFIEELNLLHPDWWKISTHATLKAVPTI